MSLLLENAAKSIRLGLRDFESEEPDRLLSCVRNLSAGILLLFKEKLLRLSPVGSNEVLIKSKIVPKLGSDGSLEFVGEGKGTVNTHLIYERFESLKIKTDWVRLQKIWDIRNEVEHYYSKTERNTIRRYISEIFIIIRNFITDELYEEPLNLLGAESWKLILKTSEVYLTEKEECDRLMSTISIDEPELVTISKSLVCNDCGSDLLTPYDRNDDISVLIKCKSCNKIFSLSDRLEEEVFELYGVSEYRRVMEGVPQNVVNCPNCDRCSFVMQLGKCLLCGEKSSIRCDICRAPLEEEELFDGTCISCQENLSED